MRRARRVILGAALAVVLAGLAAWLWIDGAAARKWASMERRIAELRAEGAARDGRRPPRDGLVPGNAWDDYLAALDLLSSDREIDDVLPDDYSDPAEPAKIEALLDRNPEALEMIRRGARRADHRHPDQFEEHAGFPALTLVAFRRISGVCLASARRLAREGRPREAADILLDLLQAANDASRNAMFCYSRYTDEFHENAVRELAALPLAPADRGEVSRELERLEADLPSCEAELRNVPLWLAGRVEDDQLLERVPAWSAWRFGFSRRLMVAAAFERAEELVALTAGIDALPFRDAEAVAADFRARAKGSGNLALWHCVPDLDGFIHSHRANRARLRLLRAAFHGERLALPDPFGTTLRWGTSPLRVWSVGGNGADDGGFEDLDLVLTIP